MASTLEDLDRDEFQHVIERIANAVLVGSLFRQLIVDLHFRFYDTWNAETAWRVASEVLDKLADEAKDLPWLDLSAAELDALGFSEWSKETGLWLIPSHLYRAIPGDTEVTAFDGETQKLSDADTDNRFGCLAFGFMPKDVPTPQRVEDGRLVRADKEAT